MEYGYTQRLYVPDSFRILAVDKLVKDKQIKGLIETVPGLRTNLFHFDPEILTIDKLIDEISECEEQLKSLDDMVIDSRIIHLPIAFEDSETKKAVAKYAESIRPDAPNVIDGYNLEYIALCNGISVEEVKKKVMETEWFNSGCGFWPGGGFFWPLDPRCAIVVPKYNPPRIWTPEGATGLGGSCIFTYTTPTGGGYQMLGRTIPTFQFAMKHPQLKILHFYTGTLIGLSFTKSVKKKLWKYMLTYMIKQDYKYHIEEKQIVVKEYIDWINTEKISREADEFNKKRIDSWLRHQSCRK